ncbi:MAG: hypothetical protein KUF82_06520 [Candidatus Thiodiazotropha sp. (ex Ctena orbiculata)]|nr:hypothetical protein [Candidatus Thiodiazotropha taylori]
MLPICDVHGEACDEPCHDQGAERACQGQVAREARRPLGIPLKVSQHGQQHCEHRGGQGQIVFPIPGEDQGRHHRGQESAERSAQRHGEVETGQTICWRPEAYQFAVTAHAKHEQRCQVDADLGANIDGGFAEHQIEHGADRYREQGYENPPVVPGVAFKAQDEGQ